MALQGFTYSIKWADDFTTRSSPPEGEEDHDAFTTATANVVGELQAYKNTSDGLYYIKPSSVVVRVKMVKTESWVLSNKKTDTLLKHEQMHYNISALGGRDLERGLLALSSSSTSELITKKEELGAKIQALIDKTNEEYDNRIMWGTDHGRIKLHQDLWEMHLAKLMNDPNGELKSVYYVMQR